jgi:methionyl-tRNA formyltransferase
LNRVKKTKTTKVAFLFDESNDWLRGHFTDYRIPRDDFKLSKFYDSDKIEGFDIVFILGYMKILPSDFLRRNALNLVVHESDLPNGKGFAPIQWQLLEGKNKITISLIEALETVDSGDIFLQNTITFEGSELHDEIRSKQAQATILIIDDFINMYPNFERKKQLGEDSFYPKRSKKDSELDANQSIIENFNLLRIGDNELWPSFFIHKDKKYLIKIYEDKGHK